MIGTFLPFWLTTPGKVLLRKFVRSKHEPVCVEVEILDANRRSPLVRFLERKTAVSKSDLEPAGDPTPKPVSNTVVGSKESGHEAVDDSFNKSSSGEEGTVEANKSCSDMKTPSENLDKQPVTHSSRIRRPPE